MKKKVKASGEGIQEVKDSEQAEVVEGAVERVGDDSGDEEELEYAPTDTPEQLAAAVEAILFAMGDAVETDTIARALDKKASDVRRALAVLQERYNDPMRGITLQYFDDAVQLSTKTEEYAHLVNIAPPPKRTVLSDSALETLSIIAYKQPITKVELEQIRGVSSDYAVNKLLELDLVREMGRKDAPGRPILFGEMLKCSLGMIFFASMVVVDIL